MSSRISFAWWNTSLSPVKKPGRATDRDRAVALEVVQHLTSVMGIDCLALGEVTASDVDQMMSQGGLGPYAFVDGTLKIDGLQFDTAVLYRRDTLSVADSIPLIRKRGSRRLKLANQINFLATEEEKPFHVFVCHWPSRLGGDTSREDRHWLGNSLRETVESLSKFEGSLAHALVLGDFNDEPFDASLSEGLLATRDRGLLRKDPTLFYNPFWRCLGEAAPYVLGAMRPSYGGSYFYKSGVHTRWRTFDQIIFSSTFLSQTEWHLNEDFTQILQLEPFDETVSKTTEIFDHFPVISVIEREQHHD